MKKRQKKKVEKRNKVNEQRVTVTRAFIKNKVDIELVDAGLTLFHSINNAKDRVNNNESYKNKKFLLNKKPRFALIQIINEDPKLWETWKTQQIKFKDSGYNEDYKPTLHRIDRTGDYEIGNLAMLSDEDHKQENAVQTALVTFGDDGLGFHMVSTIKEMSEFTGATYGKLKSVENQAIELANGQMAMYARVEQRPARPKEEMEAQDKAWYARLKASIERINQRENPSIKEIKLLKAMQNDVTQMERMKFHLL
ncbi:hypothetical protein FQ087_22090 [Sporosarcina sp. ANT_H38]|uniref:hypothetical protein n=1 Tax=unclassified Sporosarcina TaxID=2647733 RepID=UPI0011F29FB5|nr:MULTISPECIES: hypothetical protein [unclassified Sporosarcina]KAA0940152.1 hypothetical protein FQ087_22090 [Sporosarcina sp. ANT_H38]QJS06538.1 hypothetical protein [Sporosarcina sp.]